MGPRPLAVGGRTCFGKSGLLFQCGQALETQRGGRYRAHIIPNNKHPTSPKSTGAFSSLQSKPQTDSAPQLSFLTSGDSAARPLLGLRKGCVSAHTHTHTQKPPHRFQHSVIYKVVVGPREILFQKQPIGSDGMSRPFARPHDSSPGAAAPGAGLGAVGSVGPPSTELWLRVPPQAPVPFSGAGSSLPPPPSALPAAGLGPPSCPPGP